MTNGSRRKLMKTKVAPHGQVSVEQGSGNAFADLASPARADAPRVLPVGQLPEDRRLGSLKDLNGYFPFTVSPSPEAWRERAEKVRRQLLVANGLWPMPTKTALNAKIYGRVD